MCKENFPDENVPLDTAAVENEGEQEVVVENADFMGGHSIPRSILIDYIKSLGDSTGNESFISPVIAAKTIDFVHILKHRTGVPSDVADSLLHNWYKAPIDNNRVIAFNQRTKSIDELLMHLEADCNLKDVLKD